jgi:hypothetical protein
VARSQACHAFITALEHESWPANVSAAIKRYINLETDLCRHEDKFVAAGTFDEFIAIPPASETLTNEASDLEHKIEKTLGVVP